MRGAILSLFSTTGLIVFCFLLFFSSNLSLFWLFLELGTLSLIPSFFLYSNSEALEGLFNYIVVSSVSSSLIICGMLYENLFFLLVVGLLVKFGLFPFFGWVYSVCLHSNWLVVWGLSTFLKTPIFFLPFFISVGGVYTINYLCCISFLFLSVLFWVYSLSWYHCWCHMMLSSSVSLLAMSLVISLDLLFYLFLIYFIWASMVVFYFWLNGDSFEMGIGGVGYYYFFCFLLVSMPVSLSIFYKLVICTCMYSCWFLVLVCWVVYSISEQFYLLKYIMSCDLPKSGLGSLSFV